MNNDKKKPADQAQVEQELKELADADAQGGATPVITGTIALSLALCPTGKCSSKC